MGTHLALNEYQSALVTEPYGATGRQDGAMYIALANGTLMAQFFAGSTFVLAHSVVAIKIDGQPDKIQLGSFDGPDSFGEALTMAERIALSLAIPCVPHDQIDLLVDAFFTERVTDNPSR